VNDGLPRQARYRRKRDGKCKTRKRKKKKRDGCVLLNAPNVLL
jgi:hypothetical protein